MQRQRAEPAAGQCQGHVTMAAAQRGNLATEAVRSLEVRWIFPGQLEGAVVGWFGRFPARTEAREDTYLLDPRLPGLSVKVRGGRALEVKAYRGSPGILQAGRARGRMQFWQKWSFPFTRPAPAAPARPAGGRYARGGGSAGSCWPAGRSWRAPRGRGRSRDARWNSPKSIPAARTGGRWGSRRPAPRICSAAHSRPPPRSCSPTPCPVWNWARMNPGPMRSGSASGQAPAATPAREGCPAGKPAGPRVPAGTFDPHRASGTRGMAVPVVIISLARRALGPAAPGHTGQLGPEADMLFSAGMVPPRLGPRIPGRRRAKPGQIRAPLTPRPGAARFTLPRVMPG